MSIYFPCFVHVNYIFKIKQRKVYLAHIFIEIKCEINTTLQFDYTHIGASHTWHATL